MRKSLTVALLPAIALGGCALFGGGGPDARVNPLLIPPDYALTPPPPAAAQQQATGSAQTP